MSVCTEKTESQSEDASGPKKSKWAVIRNWFLWLNVIYAVMLLVVLVVLTYWGESGPLLSLPVFIPAWAWCLPSILLIPICAVVNWRAIGIHLLILALVLWLYMGYEFNMPTQGTPDLNIMVYNYAEHRGTEFDQFAQQVQADVIVLVDASKRAAKYRERFPNMHFSEVGEFLMISKYEILSSTEAVVDPESKHVIAARFDLVHPKRRIAIYAVHLPTPRHEIQRLRSNRLGGILPGRQLLSAEGRQRYQRYLDNKLALARDLMLKVEDDSLPCLVVGDLNTPPLGVIYAKVRERLADCFDERGTGYGHTFPGDADKLYAFRQPWLRIDYIFHDDNWESCSFETETSRRSQHLAIAAKLTLKGE